MLKLIIKIIRTFLALPFMLIATVAIIVAYALGDDWMKMHLTQVFED
jgi:hypothetical protein